MDVSSENVYEGKRLVKRVLADEAYDSRDNFNFLSENSIMPVIRVEATLSQKSRGCLSRKSAVIEQKRLKPKAWSRIHRFGCRWRVEGAFPSIKCIFENTLQQGRKFVNMAKEMAIKASLYNLSIGMMQTA